MKTYELKLTSAMVIAGKIVSAGSRVQLDEPTAKDFLRRGRAELVAAIEPEPQGKGEGDDSDVDISKMTKAQLVELAGQLGIEGAEGMNKAELVAAIEGADE